MKGYLFVSNSSKPGHIISEPKTVNVDSFALPAIYAADKLGYKLYIGINSNNPKFITCKQYDVVYYNQNSFRNPFAIKDNIKAYKNLCAFLEKNSNIEVIHCNTPIGGVIGRLCGCKYHKKVIYTAHGFHFFKGASIVNWLLYYPIEKWLAHYTDALITINKEDYERAKKFKLRKNGKVYYVPGVGVDLSVFNKGEDKSELRKEYNIKDDEIVFVSMGDLVPRKNYAVALNAIAKAGVNNLKYLICGNGPQMDEMKQLCVKLGIEKQVEFLGRRGDVSKIVKASDVFLFTSKQEGLARSLMEAMASGLPCVVSAIRGNTDLIDNEKGGFMYDVTDIDGFVEGIKRICGDSELRQKMGNYNLLKIKNFDINASKAAFYTVFKQELIKGI